MTGEFYFTVIALAITTSLAAAGFLVFGVSLNARTGGAAYMVS